MEHKSDTARDWRTVLREQGRTIAWLADQTGKPRRTIYAYSRGSLVPPEDWLAAATAVLGVEVSGGDAYAERVTREYTALQEPA